MVVDAGNPHQSKALRHVPQREEARSSVEILDLGSECSVRLSLVVGLAAWCGGRADRRVSEDIRKTTTTDSSCIFAASSTREELQQFNQTSREKQGPYSCDEVLLK